MTVQTETTWGLLRDAGLVQGQAPESVALDSPWYVKTLLAISGWLASLFLLGFFGAGFHFLFREAVTSLVVGGVMLSAAFAFFRSAKNEFFEHMALAVSLAGQVLIIWAIYKLNGWENSWLLTALFELVLAFAMPNFVHRVFSAYFAVFCLSIHFDLIYLPYIAGVVLLITVWLWLHEFSYPKQMQTIRAFGYGLVLALIQMKGFALFGVALFFLRQRHPWDFSQFWLPHWLDEALAALAMIYVVWHIFNRHGHRFSEPVAAVSLIAAVLFGVFFSDVQGLAIGATILALGFAGSNRVLMGLGILSLLFFVSSYYYFLHATLLQKAQNLLIVGLILLALRWLILRVFAKGSEVNHG